MKLAMSRSLLRKYAWISLIWHADRLIDPYDQVDQTKISMITTCLAYMIDGVIDLSINRSIIDFSSIVWSFIPISGKSESALNWIRTTRNVFRITRNWRSWSKCNKICENRSPKTIGKIASDWRRISTRSNRTSTRSLSKRIRLIASAMRM